MKEVVLIGNPVAGGGVHKKIETAARLIRDKGFDVRVLLTSARGDAEAFAREIAANPLKALVIAAGGDGTYNEVANGLIYSDVPMAILPLGTTSVLAHELHIPQDVGKAVEVALKGNVKSVHMGKITLKDRQASGVKRQALTDKDNNSLDASRPTLDASRSLVSRYFLLMAGIGFDAETVSGISGRMKKHTGKAAYVLSGVKTIVKYNPSPLTITARGQAPSRIAVLGYTAVISKAACYAGDFRIAPDARLTDPSFYVFVGHKKSRSALLRYVAGVIKGFHLGFKDISYFRAVEIEVEGAARVQIDGDYFGTTPAKIEIAGDALRLVMPG